MVVGDNYVNSGGGYTVEESTGEDDADSMLKPSYVSLIPIIVSSTNCKWPLQGIFFVQLCFN